MYYNYHIMKRRTILLALFSLGVMIPASVSAEKVIEATPVTFNNALAAVKKAVKKQKEDILVNLRGGTYSLQQPLVLNEAFSGRNGFRVTFKAAEGETPVISGGVKVTGWQRVSGNLYKAPFKSDKKLRTLLVNGERCRMAGAKTKVNGYGQVGEFTVNGTEPWAFGSGKGVDGIKFLADKEVTTFHNPEDVELVQNKVWTEKILCLRDIEKWGDTIVVRFQQPYGAILNSLAWAGKINYFKEFYFRNAMELLDEPGEFYFDRKAQTLYYMSNGEACAAFCGPFTASHHKSSLLIGGMFSFYNAGSATNFSNHAYKMGPMHWGILERGSKTASGAYLLMPATLGTFSVCFGKLMHHPNTRNLPFAYLIADGDKMFLIPGRNITTVGLYRDIKKWPKRDLRAPENRKSIVNFDWLSPYSVGEVLKGKKILENLREVTGDNVSQYLYHEYIIPSTSLHKGIKYYDIALRIYMGAVLKRVQKRDPSIAPPITQIGLGDWDDLSGLLLPVSEEERIIKDLREGNIETIQELIERFETIDTNYREYQWAWTYKMICDYYGINEITLEDANRIHEDYIKARRSWIAEIKKDAEKEFAMGDVEEEVFRNFVNSLDQEVDYEE